MPRLPIRSLSFALGVCAVSALAVITLRALASGVWRGFSWRVAASRLRAGAVLLAAFGFLCGAAAGQTTHEWAWMGGKSVIQDITIPGAAGVYGTMGTPAGANLPGSRVSAASWTDKSGNLWLFGGLGYDIGDNKGTLNDLWMYSPLSNLWTWEAGSSNASPKGIYGVLGVAAAANTPGGRSYPASWTDSSGNFWLFGGVGLDDSGNYGLLNDLWKFNPSTKEWTWVSGSSSVGSGCGGGTCGQDGVYGTLGKAAAANAPGGRNEAAGWTDKTGRLWLFGGFGHDASDNSGFLDDLWEFNPSTSQWTWMGGYNSVGSGSNHPGVYGTKGTAAAGNFPGTRGESATWTDSAGNFWLFGGYGYDSRSWAGNLNDLWEFNPTANQWTWVGGSSTGGGSNAQGGVYGTQGTPAAGNIPGGRYQALSWTDGTGHLWLFGGNAYDSNKSFTVANDLWEFDPGTKEWTWMGGNSNANFDGGWSGVYGTLGVPAAGNIPGSRFASVCWTDSYGNLWLWGGNGFDIDQTPGYPNDLWKYVLSTVTPPSTAAPVFSPPGGTYTTTQPVTITDKTAGAAIHYTTDGSQPTASSTLYNGPIAVLASEKIQALAVAPGYTLSAVTAANYALNLPPAATPAISLPSGYYASAQTVTIAESSPGTTIYYTTNGAQPTTASTKYTGAIAVSGSETLTAIAAGGNYAASAAASAQYIVGSSATQMIYSVAGTGLGGYSGDGGPATVAQVNSPYGMAFDKAGNMYIADTLNNRVRKVAAASGVVTTFAGNGIGGYGGDGSAATNAQLNGPRGVALDSAGNVYIADSQNNRIRVVSAASGQISTFTGTGAPGFGGDTGAATGALLNYPAGVAFDGAGNLYIVDASNFRIRKVAAGAGTISTVAGNGGQGCGGDGGAAASAQFGGLNNIAVDSAGNLYIPDEYCMAVRKVSATNNTIATVAGINGGMWADQGYSGDGGPATSAKLSYPSGAALDSAGNLYIDDWMNAVVRRVDANTQIITTMAGSHANACGLEWSMYSGDGGLATNAAFCYAPSVAADSAGNVYVSDGSSRIRKITAPAAPPTAQTAAPTFSVAAGTYAGPQTVAIADAAPGASIYFTLNGTTPTGASPGYQGPILVNGSVTLKAIAVAPGYLPSKAVSAAYTITSKPTAVIKTVAGTGVSGFFGAGGPATSAELSGPQGMALDGSGNLYFADNGNDVIWKVSAGTGVITVVAGNGTPGYSGDSGPATGAQLKYPRSVAVDGAGNLFIADTSNNVIRKVTASTGVITTVAGNGVPSYGHLSGDGGLATSAPLGNPFDVAVDAAGNFYIADYGDHAIRKVTVSTGNISTVAGNGTSGQTGDGGLATSAELSSPEGIAVDSSGNLYIADTAGRVRKVTASTGIVTTIAGNGDAGYSGDGGPAASAEVNPYRVAVDAAGNLYFATSQGVREVPAGAGTIATVAGNGTWLFGGDGGSATLAGICVAGGIALDKAGNLYVSDSCYDRVREVTFNAAAQAALPAFSPAAGSYGTAQSVTISDTTPGAAIYYTTDGTSPSASSTRYTAAIKVSANETIEAMAVASGYANSWIAAASYIIAAPAPTFTPAAGAYNSVQLVTIADVIPGAAIYYTLDGSVPTTSSARYSTPLTISQATTVKAIAAAPGYGTSTAASAAYSVTVAQEGAWAWMSGSSTVPAEYGGVAGVYGTLGAPAAGNHPGGRIIGSVAWMDKSGNLWVFGGAGFDSTGTSGSLNDLWKFNPSSRQWTWMGGSSTVGSGGGQPGVYGTLGTPSAGSIPGGRSSPSSWTDSSGNFWVFGGGGYDATGKFGDLNDLWEFNPSTLQWTWVSGGSTVGSKGAQPGVYGTLGVPAAGNTPGGRVLAASWTDSGGNLWLFGGIGVDSAGDYAYLNDLWKFNSSTSQWAWMGGSSTATCNTVNNTIICTVPGVYGTQGVAAAGNVPPGRFQPSSWTDKAGNLWLFGGSGQTATGGPAYFNDLWEFNPSNREWNWMGGSSSVAAQPGVYGTLGIPAAANMPGGRNGASTWTDSSGNLWLFGGGGPDSIGTWGQLNDLWSFNPATRQWTWKGGSSLAPQAPYGEGGHAGIYGTLGVAAAGNFPGGRSEGANWLDSSGNVWLFGGFGNDSNGLQGELNDLWKGTIGATQPAAATPTFSPAAGSYSGPQSVTLADATPGTAIYYTTDGTTPTISSTKYTAAIKVSTSETIEAVAVAAGYANSWVASATYTIALGPAAAPIFSPPAGIYATAPTVTITTATPGATIYYTTDGTTPTTGSTKYAGAIKVSSSQTLTAIAVAPGYLASPPATAQYVIGTPQTTYVYTVAGNGTYGYAGDGGQATLAQVAPYKAVSDSAGNLYIADTNNNRVRKVAAGTGVITTVAGSGVQGFSGDNGPAVNAQLTWVTSIALDGAGYLYICDTGAQIVRRVNLATGIIATYAGSPNWWGYGGDGKAATSAQLAGPAGIALDSAGNLYIADTGNARIRKVAAATGIITTVAGNGTTGSGGDGGPATAANLNNPKGLAVDGAGNLYIADTGNNVVRMVSASGKITTFAGNGVAGYGGDGGPATKAQLNQPSDVAVDSLGNLFIADYTNGVVRKVTAGTGIIGTVAGQQQYACQGTGQDGGVASAARFCNLDGVSVDPADNLYVADNGDARIRKVVTLAAAPVTATAAPVFSLAAGTYAGPQTAAISDATPGAAIYYSIDGSTPNGGYPGYGHSIGVTSSVTLSAIAIAPGYLPSAPAVARYVVTSAPASVIQTYAGNGSWGFTGMGGAATSAQIGSPQGVATDSGGNVYFADIGNNVVWKVTAKTGIITVMAGNGKAGYSGDKGSAASAQLNTPSGIALDTAGNLYIADQKNNAVRKVTAATGVIATVAGNGTAGSTGNGGQATAAELSNPTAVALDSAGNLYISDTNNSLVRKVTANTGVITTFAGNGNWYSGDGGPATSAGVGNPQGLAFDSAGNLYILDATPRVRKVEAGTGIVTTVAGSGAWGYSGDGGPATSAEISAGQGNGGYIAFDAANNLYLSNNGGVVREVSAATGVINTIAGSGIWGSFGDGGTPTLAEMAGTAGVAFDKAGNLFIADSFNSRIREVVPGNPAPTPAFSLASGKYTGTQTVSITDSLAGATIYYTTDGSAPNASSAAFSGSILVAASETLSAVATAPGRTPSAIATAAYTISVAPKAATPTFSVAAGTYPTALNVAIASATPGAVVYYTTDGTTPGSGSTKYTAAIKVSANETLQAMAIAPGYSTSAVASASYAINPLAVGGKLQWAWMGGSNTLSCWSEGCGTPGVYGTLGTPATSNIPAGRDLNARWTDSSGNFWFFGGWVDEPNGSYGELNDLWRFNPATKQWTWMGGGSTFAPCTSGFCGPAGVYGTKGTPAAGNIPGGRGAPITWTDSKGRFWLFGGWGPDSTGTYGTLNDLWEFDPSANQWTWMGGPKTVPAWSGNPGVYGTKGTPAAGNLPGSRSDAVTWQDAGGNFWLYGGNGYDASGNSGYLSDLWEFNPSTGQWTWVGGNSTMNCPAGKNTGCGQQGVYGTLGVAAAANWPGSRSGATFWKDSSGNLWLFGGNGFDINGHGGTLNDLWEWNATTKQWAWMNGSSFLYCSSIGCGIGGTFGPLASFGPENAPGARIDAAVWTDSAGNAWLLGGQGNDSIGNYGTLNDLWEYKPSINQWAWMGGASTMNCGASCGAAGTYGTLGTPNGGNMPGGRTAAMHWTDSSGNLWLFAGKGNDSGANSGELNDLWIFQP